jgi:hypothetical protein
MRLVRWGSLVSLLPQLWLVACPAMCGPTGRFGLVAGVA